MLSDVLFRLRFLFRKKATDAELDDELGFHFEHLVEKYVNSGLTREEARRRARLTFGGADQVKEECREARGVRLVETFFQDVRYSLRTLRKSPAFATTVVLTLALGIGANTAIFSVVESTVLAPLRYSEPDRLVGVWESNPRWPHVWISYLNFRDWQRNARSFAQMAAFNSWKGYDLTNPGTSEHLNGKQISAGFFSTLGVKLAHGRDFTFEEDVPGGALSVIVSDRLWRARFQGSPEALGKSVTINGADYTIVGIAPPGFRLESDADVYTPLGQGDAVIVNNRASHDTECIARLKPGISLQQARTEMRTIQKSLDELYPDADRDIGADVVPLKEQIVGNVSGMLLLLLGAVGFVLLIACANVANLLLARSAARSREFAIRLALGASRARLVRQLLTESVLLSLAGGGLGLVLAAQGVRAVAATSDILPRSQEIALSGPVLVFALSVAVVTGILFGLAPALKHSKAGPEKALQEGGRTSSGGRHRVQNILVIVQTALTLVLLAGAGLLLRTIRHLGEVNAGFDAERLLTFNVGVSPSLTKTVSSTRVAYQQMIERIRAIPGVQAADFTSVVPLSGESGIMPFWIGSQKPLSLQAAPRLNMFLTGPDYLRTMNIPLLRGRFFTAEDTTQSPCVMVIDNAFASTYFPDSDPIGQTISAGFKTVGPCTIVGVVGHVRHWGLDEPAAAPQSQAYLPLSQDPDEWVPANYPYLKVMVRTRLETAAVMPAIQNAVYEGGRDQPIYHVTTMPQIVSDSMSSQRFPMMLLGGFAVLAMLMASLGIYGLISYSVAQRVREIGIRMVLGAGRGSIFRMVIAQGLRLVLAGLAIGTGGALVLTRMLSSFSNLLYGVGVNDPATFVTVSLVLISVAIFACYIPARRATRVDPMVPLRHE